MTVPRIYRVCLDLLLWWEYYISLAWSTKIYNKRCRKWPSGLCCKGELFSTINLCHDYFKKSSANKFDRRIDSNESVYYYHIIIWPFFYFRSILYLIFDFRWRNTSDMGYFCRYPSTIITRRILIRRVCPNALFVWLFRHSELLMVEFGLIKMAQLSWIRAYLVIWWQLISSFRYSDLL